MTYGMLAFNSCLLTMMLATNKEINSKEDVVKVAAAYFSGWRIEE